MQRGLAGALAAGLVQLGASHAAAALDAISLMLGL